MFQFSLENEKKINQTEIMPNHVKQVIYNGVFFLKKIDFYATQRKKNDKINKKRIVTKIHKISMWNRNETRYIKNYLQKTLGDSSLT